MHFLFHYHHHHHHRNGILSILCISLILFLGLPCTVSSSSLTASFPVSQEEEEICGNIDIRNSVKNFEKLRNCTVIEGFLQIVLIDYGESSAYTKLSFPKLREITGYLFLYRVANLTSLANLFPNLSVIRGAKLFRNYALVIYQMLYLQEIGLPSLTTIVRGSVHISKNSQLCYVDTIDWDVIARSGKGGHFINGNKENNQCPNDCPQHQQCPTRTLHNRLVKLCWNRFHCQKVCHCTSGACNDNGECCHEECLGGCNGQGPGNCSACKRVFWKGMCLSKCPAPTNKFVNRRCISDEECLNMTKLNAGRDEGEKPMAWKLFNGTCVDECPFGYKANESNVTSCLKCNGTCPIECPGLILVDSIAAAQSLKQQGCTRIKGALEIQISGNTNVVRELEENLMMIKEVDDYVKIVHSKPLISLNFLRNLKKIHGLKTNDGYALRVFNNQNLQELIDLKNYSKLEIMNGKVYFHFNSKLCKSKIEEFLNFNNIRNWDDNDVSAITNGDRVACTVHPLAVNIYSVTSMSAAITWQNFQSNMNDHRNLLAYVVSYKEAPSQNVSIYEGRDGCGADTWKTEDVGPSKNKSETEGIVLLFLNPFTQYAFYIKTYTIAKEDRGAQSPIVYFKTLPDIPSSPTDVKITSLESSTLEISWQPPNRPNGNITHYIIKGYYLKYDQDYLFRRNYCESPLEIPERTKTVDHDISSPVENKTLTHLGKCCACPKEKPEVLKSDEAEFQIDFEDSIHNHVYIKRPSSSERKKRSIETSPAENYVNSSTTISVSSSSSPSSSSSTSSSTWYSTTNPELSKQPEDYLAFHTVVNMSTKTVIKNLHHFSEYMIEIVACQDYAPKGEKFCSRNKAITNARTSPLSNADNINSSSVSIQPINGTSDRVNVTWETPASPNGLIVTYRIEYNHLNIDKFKTTPVCITQKEYEDSRGYVIRNLSPGNYSLRIQATSLAGDSNWTYPVEFIIHAEPSTLNLSPADGANTQTVILSAVLGSIVLVLVGFIITYYIVRRHLQKIPNDILYASVNPEYMTTIYKVDEWEISRDNITLIRELGQGSFGMVYEGIAKNIKDYEDEIKCAVKTVNEFASVRERIEFLNEASVMKTFSCHHVVKLMGVVSKGQPTLVVMELMASGDLKSYLRSHRPDVEENNGHLPPTLKRILQMAGEIADGMAYLAAKKFVHRDLAARNCMVAEDLTVKIGDFGMTRDIYETDYYRKGGKGLLPVRWMAPESLKDGIFTSQSDVWSYGIVLWEMATLASQPYLGLSNEQVLKYVIDGGIMKKPENCPNRLYDLMNMCWEHSPKMRPSFMEIVNALIGDVSPKFHELSFYSTQTCNVLEADEPSPSTPLKNVNNIHNDLHVEKEESDDSDSECVEAKSLSSGKDYCSTKDVESNHAEIVHSNEGSKGSKISDYSLNGGLANGHVNLPYSNHAAC